MEHLARPRCWPILRLKPNFQVKTIDGDADIKVPAGVQMGLRRTIEITYPLVICYIAIEHGHRNRWFTQLENGDFPVRYVTVYQRVKNGEILWQRVDSNAFFFGFPNMVPQLSSKESIRRFVRKNPKMTWRAIWSETTRYFMGYFMGCWEKIL